MGNLTDLFGGNGFDSSQVEPAQDFAPIPSGEYPAIIIDSNVKPTKAGDGEYLELTHQVIDGPFKGRLVWARLNLRNKNAKAKEIADRQLSSICHAVDVLKPEDSASLHNLPLVIRVEFVNADGVNSRKDFNEVKAWKSIKDAPPAGTATAQTAASAPPVANAAPGERVKPSWGRPAGTSPAAGSGEAAAA